MTTGRTLVAIARTDRTFERFEGGRWRGKCLICNGFLEFDEQAAPALEATVEHILSRANGGDEALTNLAVVHPRCNHEKGRRTDPAGPGDPRHDRIVGRLLELRRRRWREPDEG